MTAKEYLNQAFVIDREIQRLLVKIEKMRSLIEYRSPSFDGGGGCLNSSDRLGEAVAKIVDYERKADELIDKLVDKRCEIENAVQAVQDAVQREVLERRYLLYQPWESRLEWCTDEMTGKRYRAVVSGIAEDMNYSVRAIYKIHQKALKNISVPEKECSEVQL